MPATVDHELIAEALKVELWAMGAGGRHLHTALGAARLHPAFPFLSEANHFECHDHARPEDLPRLLPEASALLGVAGRLPRLLFTSTKQRDRFRPHLVSKGYTCRGVNLWLRPTRLRLPSASPHVDTRFAASIEDLDGIDTLHQRALSDVEDEVAWSVINARRQELDEHLGMRWLIAPRADGRLAGAAGCFTHGPIGSIQWVRTAEAFRRRGIARALTATLCEHLTQSGVAVVSLVSEAEDQPALALYASLGFAIHRRLSFFEPPH